MRAAALALAVVLAGCAASDDPGEPGGDTFLAFASSFEGFRDWPSFHDDVPAAGAAPNVRPGPRTLYVNELPATGATAFPVGTIVVEALEDGSDQLLAAVKRGGGYNGGRDWEWFEITEAPLTIVWRGLGPPNGESYGGDRDACNSCHAECGAGNDLRCSPSLQLTSF